MTPESSSDTPIRFRLFVAQADGLISYRLRFLARHRFYVTATDGAATRQTSVIRRSKDRSSVEWNESLGDFTVVPSSCLALRLCMKRRSSDFQVAGTLELQFDALRDSFVARDFDVVTVGEQRVTLRMAIEVSEPRLPVPNSGPASGSRTDHTPAKSDMALDLGSSLRVPLAADEALHRADEVTGRVKEPVHPLTAAMGHANNTLNILDRAGTMHDTWKKAVDKIRWVVDVTDKIAEVHPYAKMAWNIISLIPKALLAQVERDRNVQALLEAIHDAFDLISEEDLSRSMSAKQREILLAMLGHVHDCGGFIQTYAKNTGFHTA
ncbi:hypothetical protein BC834DRAFT_843556 [Gloeopeniophorella convolvens]|nr:hypothetical protein BC834DRAFT_843556 [Gloeopeniophorella convolvens]